MKDILAASAIVFLLGLGAYLLYQHAWDKGFEQAIEAILIQQGAAEVTPQSFNFPQST